ncbi:MAG: UDP-N-acetylmuramate--L-alanine ligase [Clostridia bacterium]|nr:UDP-N-acetylmuramate--L-alanine ligase [Clostridia bacterium]
MNTSNTRLGAEAIEKIMRDARRVFFLGVGGINMCSLASITDSLGYEVSGSDRAASHVTERLKAEGITVHIGHAAENAENADVLVYTLSIPVGNPEYTCAGERGIPRISRADYLGWLMHDCGVRLGVSGMHGKSTVTSMCASILISAGVNPTISSGADIHELGCSYRAGGREYFLYEACEYKDSFLSFYPTTAVILNIDMDHPDYFTDIDMVKSSFAACLSRVRDTAVVNYSDKNVREVIRDGNYSCKIVKFGTSLDEGLMPREEYDVFADNIKLSAHGSEFDLYFCGEPLGTITLHEAGLHNVSDAAAAAAASLNVGIDVLHVKEGLSRFRGAARRMEHMGVTESGADVYLDYAHHPTEIAATLRAAKLSGGHLTVIFQPHTYTRTKALFDKFADALMIADTTAVADIYAAREDDIYGVSSEMLAHAVRERGGNAVWSGELDGEGGEFARLAAYAESRAGEGDVIIVMGAGDIDRATGEFHLK